MKVGNKKITQQEYKNFSQQHEPKRPVLLNCIKAFLVGGLICVVGQFISNFFIHYMGFTKETAGNPTVAVLVIISIFCTGIGIYDHLAQWAGAGTAVPITGFANTMASSAIEHKSEGYVLGVGGNMFKLAGSVIVFGVFAAFVVAIIKIVVKSLGGF